MDAEREKMIRHTWKNLGGNMEWRHGEVLYTPELEPTPGDIWEQPFWEQPYNDATRTLKVLEYRCDARVDGDRRILRVICEGIVVEERAVWVR